MDKMRAEIKGKIKYWGRLSALFAILLATNCTNYFRTVQGSDSFTDFFQGFQLGIAAAFVFFAAGNIMRYRKILADDDAVRACYIKMHDERCATIEEKSGGTVLYTCGILVIGAAIVAGYFNPVVFVTLLGCGLFLLLVKKGLRIYYCKTM